MRRFLWALLLAGCVKAHREGPGIYRPGVGECPAHRLTSACRDAEWPLLRENPQAAAATLERGCEETNPWACFELGLLLSRWHHVPRDESRALSYFTTGCHLHLGVSCAAAARMLEAGKGAARDLDRAAGMHGRACWEGLEASCAERKRLLEFEERDGELTRSPGEAGLTADEIARVMERRRGSVAYCVELSLERDPQLMALGLDLKVQLSIDAGGRVAASKVTGTIDEPLAWCVGETVRDFQFPKPSAGQVVSAEHVYTFAMSGNPEGRDIQTGPRERPTDPSQGVRIRRAKP